MALSPQKFEFYVDTIVKRTGMSPEAATAALQRTGSMPNIPDEIFDAVQNYDVMGKSGMPEQVALKNLYLDHFDVSGSGQPRSTLKAGNVQDLVPKAKPLVDVSSVEPVPKTSAPTTTKVGTTPTPRGRVARPVVNLDRPALAAYNPVPGGNVNLSAVRPAGVAGEVVENTPGFMGYLQELIGAGAAGKSNALKYLRGKAVPIAGATGVLSVLAAANELTDEEDPFARNLAQAGGNLAGGWAGAASGAALGASLGSVVPIVGTAAGGLIGGVAGGIMGTGAGAGIAGSIYDTVTDVSPEDRRQQQIIKDANLKNKLALQQAATQRQIMVDDLQSRIPIMKDTMAIKRADDFARGERTLRVQNDYNYANALNQAMINAQQQAATQELALTQFMMG